nr:hypothetical protein CFP56_79086 [Quercus suber]
MGLHVQKLNPMGHLAGSVKIRRDLNKIQPNLDKIRPVLDEIRLDFDKIRLDFVEIRPFLPVNAASSVLTETDTVQPTRNRTKPCFPTVGGGLDFLSLKVI